MSRLLLGILGALAVAVAGYAIVQVTMGGDDAYRVWVALPDAAGLREGSQVKIGGVPVGMVDGLQITARDTARARLKIKPRYGHLGRDAQAWIRPANLLGEKYVDLRKGDPRTPLPDGATIPRARTRVPVEVDQIIDVLTPETRARLALLLREAGMALDGRGKSLSATVAALPPSLDDATALLDEVTADNRRLRALLDRAGGVAASVAPARDDLAGLVRDAAAALRIAGERRAQIDGTLAQTPGTLAQLRATLTRLETTSSSLRPAAAGLRRTAAPLTETLRALPGFATSAKPALGDLRAASPTLTRLVRELRPTLRRLRPTAQEVAGLGADTDALSATLDRAAPDLTAMVQAWASAVQPRDGLSHLFRLTVSVNQQMIDAIAKYVVGPTPPARRRKPARPAAPRPMEPVKAVSEPVRKVVDEVTEKPLDVPKIVQPVVDRTTDLLDFLLGP